MENLKIDIQEKRLQWCNDRLEYLCVCRDVYVCTSVSVRRAAASWPDVAGLPSDGEEKSLP